ncbi:ABC transporter permease [Halolamina litorea]|nr:ABC transporter permease [Halolamina litorea]
MLRRLSQVAARRLALMALSLTAVSIITFAAINVLPGDVALMILGQQASEERLMFVREQLGLNRPLWVRYLDWAGSMLTGDLGASYYYTESVQALITQRLPKTAFLAFSAIAIAVSLSIPLGILAALHENERIDLFASLTAFAGLSLPNFFWGMVLILVFAQYLDIFPPSGYTSPLVDPIGAVASVVLPASALAFGLMAHIMRMTRSSLLEELRAGYVQLGRMKGMSERAIVFRHALRNAFLPVLTVIGFQLAYLFGGVVIIEEVFSYPGLGRLLFNAVLQRDVPVLQTVVLIFAAITMLSNLTVDLLYAVFDPRIGSGGGD